MIVIIDYGLGNIKAFVNIFKKLNIPHKIAQTELDLTDVSKIILPGVGAFDHAMKKLNESGMRKRLDELVLIQKTPVLGICVGMQILSNTSEEGNLAGLGYISGTVKKLDLNQIKDQTKLPHMGWNDVIVAKKNLIFENLENDALFYFLHSYYFECQNEKDEIATSVYGTKFTVAVNSENIFGVQFHPEKSHDYGIELLNNFATL